MVAETKTVKASSLPRSGGEERVWEPAAKLFDPNKQTLDKLCLSVYNSSPGRFRWFCSRCGTPVGYSIGDGLLPKEWGWPKMLDILLGTIDREHLEHDYMAPERAMWCHFSIPCIRNLLTNGLTDFPLHPLTKIDKMFGEDIDDDLQALRALKAKS